MLKPPLGVRSYLSTAHKHTDPRRVETRRLMMLTPNYLITNRSEQCPWADHTLPSHYYKTSHYTFGLGHTVLRALAYCDSFAWQSNKALLFLWKWKCWLLNHVPWGLQPSWTVACQAPPSMEFSRQVYWSGLPFPSTGNLSNQGIKPGSPSLQANSLQSEPPGKCFLHHPKLCLWHLI